MADGMLELECGEIIVNFSSAKFKKANDYRERIPADHTRVWA
jgi:hypothetical protein